ncbi:hypothetical protein SH661x_000827 [Planctomicrobium sp. SH661]|uniref:hypothetical protein n=1 Tax=Planctomicrobium sp. SH661 TaxID=3448124 RepID=UPI003F5C34A5
MMGTDGPPLFPFNELLQCSDLGFWHVSGSSRESEHTYTSLSSAVLENEEMVPIPKELASIFPADRDELFNYARCHVDSTQLHDIAIADYGWGLNEVLPALQIIAGRGKFPAEISFQLQEALRLTVYSDPDRPNPPPYPLGPVGRTAHQTRLFACTILMYAATDSAFHFEDEIADYTLASGLKSAIELGMDAMNAMGKFLTWQSSMSGSPEPVFNALAILILALSQPPVAHKSFLEPIADWVLATEGEFQKQICLDGWISKRPLPFSLQQGAWKRLENTLQIASQAAYPVAIKEKLRLCSLLLGDN